MGEMEYRSLMERLRIYDEVIRLRRAGLGYRRISKVLEAKYGISMNPGAICNWITISLRSGGDASRKRRENLSPMCRDGKTLSGDGLSRDLTYYYTIC